MKNYLLVIILTFSLYSCKQKVQSVQSPVQVGSTVYDVYGAALDAQSVLPISDLAMSFSTMQKTDTLFTKVQGTIKEVCTKKGCWMTLDLGDEKDLMVRFKDYGFFMPLEAKGDVIINGFATISETSVEDLKHYAEDAGATELEIEAIIAPKLTYSFEADGVLLAH
ncbi:MAG: DUF4920 domain-containing protein [Flavobacteriaceae bacterium]|jgi:hypothetical protein|nr:DUF4920 domain-containing protein [Flavobacteriaceae bacterium]MDA7848938.1 DUF4920 domain-containing protein [Flavobacteriaceae bacterium]MDG1310075.1 DUF4920 domain-containing protein [Flavobacteriaceae bacterium]